MRDVESLSHVLVIGAGIAGLVTARVLSDHFRRVTIVERDRITADTGHRSGIPQARHPHALLTCGAEVLEELFPGLLEEIAGASTGVGDVGRDMRILLPSGWAPRADLGLISRQSTRVTLERIIRRRVTAIPSVTIVSGVQVDGLVVESGRVTGVSGFTDPADLVVDASGRNSRLPDWLEHSGFPRPDEVVVDGHLTYTSRLYDAPADTTYDWITSYQPTYAPHVRRGGVVATVDKGQWLITLLGAGGEKAPTDERGFAKFAASLDNPDVAACIASGTPRSGIYRSANLNNRWRNYHRVAGWPERLVAVGDSVCSLNPVYGQGMTVAALQAVALRDLLRRSDDLGVLSRRFQRAVAGLIRVPWMLATSADLGWNAGKPTLPARMSNWYLTHFLAAIPGDADLLRRMLLVQHMVAEPVELVRPTVFGRVVRQALRRDHPSSEKAAPAMRNAR